jgi:hypothetical protein
LRQELIDVENRTTASRRFYNAIGEVGATQRECPASAVQDLQDERQHPVRGIERVLIDESAPINEALSGHKDPGLFGRMFPSLEPLNASDAALQALANAMIDASPGDASGNNPNVPAGFTYLGQFVDHDITLDLTSIA